MLDLKLVVQASANVALNGLWNVVLYNAGAGNSSDAMPVVRVICCFTLKCFCSSSLQMPIASYHPNALRNFGSVRVGMVLNKHPCVPDGTDQVPDEEETSIEHVRIMSIDELQLPACDFIKVRAYPPPLSLTVARRSTQKVSRRK